MISDLSPAEIPTIIDAVSSSTAVLAVITYYYAKETGIIRKTGQNPSFWLESRVYIREENSANNISIRSISLHSHKLILINNVLQQMIFKLIVHGEIKIQKSKTHLPLVAI